MFNFCRVTYHVITRHHTSSFTTQETLTFIKPGVYSYASFIVTCSPRLHENHSSNQLNKITFQSFNYTNISRILNLEYFRYDVDNPLKPGSPSSGTQFNIHHDLRLTPSVLSALFSNRENKSQFYRYLSPQLASLFQSTTQTLIITDEEKTIGRISVPCNHLEADYRIIMFLFTLAAEGNTRFLVRTGDTDVVIILTGHMKLLLQQHPSCQVTVLFCTPSSRDYIDVNKLANWIGLDYCMGFMLLYTFTGCDATPSFSFHGKSKWLDIYLKSLRMQNARKHLSSCVENLNH